MTGPQGSENVKEPPPTWPCIHCGTSLDECGDPPCCAYNDHPYPSGVVGLDSERATALRDVEAAVAGLTFEVPRGCSCHEGEMRRAYDVDVTADVAWADAEAALPKAGWMADDGRYTIADGRWSVTIVHVQSGDGYYEPVEEGFKAFATVEPGFTARGDLDPSPAGALQSLASRLSDHKDLRT